MNNKKIIIIFGAMLLMFCAFKVGTTVGAASSEPGSAGDPLITQSYLEARLKDVSGNSSSNYQTITIEKNETVNAEEGTEIILYSGNANVTGTKGLLNLSSGELFQADNSVVKYNIFLSPSTGSGIKATTAVTLFIKGSYTVK